MSRKRPPFRRQNQGYDITHNGRRYTIYIGYNEDGDAIEVFADGAKTGTESDYLLEDACVAVSLLLQHGSDPKKLSTRFSTQPEFVLGKLETVFGSIIGKIAELCAEKHEGIVKMNEALNG